MLSEDNFQYAIENTQVIVAPQQRIETFGNTSFRFYLISELMDRVNEVRVRDGRIHAERPQILAPGHLVRMLLEGFGEQAGEFAESLKLSDENLAVLKYGFQFRKTDVVENVIQSPVEKVIERIKSDIQRSEEPLCALIQGVDEAWEVCLLKFAIDMIQRSSGDNLGDLRRRGLL